MPPPPPSPLTTHVSIMNEVEMYALVSNSFFFSFRFSALRNYYQYYHPYFVLFFPSFLLTIASRRGDDATIELLLDGNTDEETKGRVSHI